MIVRILGDGQYELDDEAFARTNEMDDRVEAAIEADDADAFASALRDLVTTIRELGSPVAIDRFVPSGAIVPDADTTMDEARDLLGDQGLVPDSK